jgi:DNA-binding response OmpR family regulator
LENTSPHQPPRILIVEDDADLVETYTDLLEAHGYAVLSVLRAADAIQMITRQKPALVILDLNLPGEPGSIVLNFVRGYAPVADTRIIVATGHPEALQKSRFISASADAILTKPVSNQQLLATIRSLLNTAVSS